MKVLNTDNIRTTSAYTGAKKTRTYKIGGKEITDHHYGIDIKGSNDVLAHTTGRVVKVVNKGKKGGTMCLIRLQHQQYQTAYYHLKSGSILFKVGDLVREGQKIATMGDTGKVTGPHLHFQIDKGSKATAIDPTDYAYGRKLVAPLEDWETGDYRLLKHKYLRSTPEVKSNNKVKYKNLTDNAKKKCIKDALGYAKYKIDAKINIKEFKTDSKGNVWGRTNTLWVCVEDSSGNQVIKV